MQQVAVEQAIFEADVAVKRSGSYVSRKTLMKALIAFLQVLEQEGNVVERMLFGWVRRRVEKMLGLEEVAP